PLLREHRLEDHRDADVVDHPADDDAAQGQHPPVRVDLQHAEQHEPDREAEVETEVLHERQLLASHDQEQLVEQLRVRGEVADHHELGVDQLIDVRADLVRDVPDYAGQLLPDPGVHGLLDDRRQVVPELRVLLFHDQLYDIANRVLRNHRQMFG